MVVRWISGMLVAALALGAGCSAAGGGGGGGGTITGDSGTGGGTDTGTGGGTDASRMDTGTGGGADASRMDGASVDAAAQCATATACGACTAMGACGWCGRTGRCMAGGSSGSADMSCTGADWAWISNRCGPDGGVLPPVDASAQCAMATGCGACTAMGPCGWCGRTGRCMQGGSAGSADMSCTGADWAYTSNRCGADGGVLPPPDGGEDCFGVPRSCGLTLAGGVRTCTAGQMVTVGCNAGCSPALGMCTGDAVMQICPGTATTAACSGTAVIASNDDAPMTSMCRGDGGTNLCPVTTFMCPSSGMYTIWVGAYDAADMATCVPAVR